MVNMEDSGEDVITDHIHPYFQYDHATQGQRFINFFIDNLLMRLALSYVTGLVIGKVGFLLFPDFMYRMNDGENNAILFVLAYIIVIINYLVYYTLCEKLLRGYTLGKLITKTRAIRTDGDELTFIDALLRSLCRLVPCEVFSGFGVPWHDRWTNTMVVKANSNR